MSYPPLKPLPAMRHLGDLAERLPTIVIDTREQTPLPFSRLPTIRDGLYTADYSVAGMDSEFGVERKSIDDLVGCCCGSSRDRFMHELQRLRGFRFARLLIVGRESDVIAHRYRSRIKPAAVLGTVAAIQARFVPAVWIASAADAGAVVEEWAWWAAREHIEIVNDVLRGTVLQRMQTRN